MTWNIDTLEDLPSLVRESLDVMEGVDIMDYTDSDRIEPATIIIVPTEPFLVPSDQFGGAFDVGYQLILIPQPGENAASELNGMITKVIDICEEQEFDLIAVSAPRRVEVDTLSGTKSYWGSVLELEFITTISRKDVS